MAPQEHKRKQHSLFCSDLLSSIVGRPVHILDSRGFEGSGKRSRPPTCHAEGGGRSVRRRADAGMKTAAGIDAPSPRQPAARRSAQEDLASLIKKQLSHASDARGREGSHWVDGLGRRNPIGGYYATYVKRDFLSAFGYELPCKSLGGRKLGALLRGLCAVCSVHQDPGGHMVLYPAGDGPAKSPESSWAADARRVQSLLEERLAEFALFGSGLRVSALRPHLPEGAAAGGRLQELLQRAALTSFRGRVEVLGDEADGNPTVRVNVDPVADLLKLLTEALRCGATGGDAPPRELPLERVKNDFRHRFGYAFQHVPYGYAKLADLLVQLAPHAARVCSNPRAPAGLVLRPAEPPPRRDPLVDLRRLLIERMRVVRCAEDRRRQGTEPSSARSVYLGAIKPDFLRRYGYAFCERAAGFPQMLAAVEAQSDICRPSTGERGQAVLLPAEALHSAGASAPRGRGGSLHRPAEEGSGGRRTQEVALPPSASFAAPHKCPE